MRFLCLLLLATPAMAQPGFKGQELYSWQSDGHWNYAILIGTNRNKSWPEVEQAGLGGLEQLEKRLDGLAKGEAIFWLNRCEGGAGHLSFPGEEVKRRIVQACQARQLKISLPEIPTPP